MVETTYPTLVKSVRQTDIQDKLKDMFGQLFNIRASEIDSRKTFIELGADSLFLLQASQEVNNRFGIKVPFRSLLEEIASIEALATHIIERQSEKLSSATESQESHLKSADGARSPSGLQTPPAFKTEKATIQNSGQQPANPPTPSLMNTEYTTQMPNPSFPETRMFEDAGRAQRSALERIMTEQLRVMAHQLELLRLNGQNGRKIDPVIVRTPPDTNTRPDVDDLTTSLTTPPSIANIASHHARSEEVDSDPYIAHQPLRKTNAELTPQQQEHVNALIERVNNRTKLSKQFTQKYRPRLADNRATAGFRQSWKEMVYPIIEERGIGSHIWDIDGNEYVDITMGFGSLMFGHSPSFVIKALQSQIEQGIRLGPLSHLAGRVAELICQLTGVERAAFCNSGTEAVMTALRLARAVTGRTKIALFAGSYHGTFDGVLVRPSRGRDGNIYPFPMAPGVPAHMVQDVLLLEYNNPDSIETLRKHAHELAAVLITPVMSRRPDLRLKSFLWELRRATELSGTALIFDEVVTGFRIDPGGAQAMFGIQADLVIYGKALGGGMPIGVVAGKSKFMDPIDGGMWQYGDSSYPRAETTLFVGTFFKHPLVMAAVWAVLNHIKENGKRLYEELSNRTEFLAKNLNEFFNQVGAPIYVGNFASFFMFLPTSEIKNIELFYYHLLEKGVYVWEGRTCFLSTAHTDEDIDHIVRVVKESVREMQRGGFFPSRPELPSSSEKELRASVDGSKTAIVVGVSSIKAGVAQDSIQIFPMTEAQKQLWYQVQVTNELSRAYNQSMTFHLRGSLRLAPLYLALQTIVNRHEALRTTFSVCGNYQHIHHEQPVNLQFFDLSSRGKDWAQGKVSELLLREGREAFDLLKGPLLRLCLIKVEEKYHLFVMTLHHIISDGISMGIFVQELKTLYAAGCEGIPYQLPEPAKFSEYTRRILAQQHGPEMETAESYWLQHFSGPLPILKLPVDRPRQSIPTFGGAKESLLISNEIGDGLRSIALRCDCTLFVLLLAAYKTFLFRLSGQSDVIVGVPSAGQPLMSEYLFGFAVNFLPLRTNLSNDPKFIDYLVPLKGVLLDALAYQIYPFNKLVEKLNPQREFGLTPLVSAAFNGDRTSGAVRFLDLEVEALPHFSGFTQFDIILNVTEIGDDLLFDCYYSTDLFEAETIRRWIKYLETLLKGIVANPHRRLSELPFLPDEEREQLVTKWSSGPIPDSNLATLPRLFESQVFLSPDSIAILSVSGLHLTYSGLNAVSSHFARRLRARGVAAESFVALYGDRSPETIICLIAILKAGACYVPLDLDSPPRRLSRALDDLGRPLMLASASVPESLTSHCAEILQVDDLICRATDETESIETAREALSDNLAYVIYTSGSTGEPKGVMITHEGLSNYLSWSLTAYPLEEGAVSPVHSSLSFDLTVTSLFPPLLTGGCLMILPDSLASEELVPNNYGLIKLTPSHLRLLSRTWREGAARGVRGFVIGGEALNQRDLWFWQEDAPEARLFNEYGPTETVVGCCVYEAKVVSRDTERVPIGKPISNTKVYVLDEEQQPVPIGVVGELYIGGAGMARGYLNRPELTGERFVPNPYAVETGERMYRTGDRVRWLGDGNLEYLGRVDQQVKIRGYRIELGEIETALKEHKGVEQAVALLREGQDGDQRLVAYVTPESVDVKELRQYLQGRLPEYMSPSRVVKLPELPMTKSGKPDRHRLSEEREKWDQEWKMRGGSNEKKWVARTPVEEIVESVWTDVLEVESVGAEEHFFGLGGHSLQATRVVAHLRDIFQVGVTLPMLFEAPVLRDFSARIEAAIHESRGITLPPIEPRPVTTGEDGWPLSYSQQRLWFLHQLEPYSAAYHIPAGMWLYGRLNLNALAQSIVEIIRRHEVLRSSFPAPDGQPMQLISHFSDAPFNFVDLVGLNIVDAEIEQRELTPEIFTRPFDLAEGPLLRFSVLRLAEFQHLLVLVMHHIVSDGVSMGIIFRELAALYGAYCRSAPSPLEELRLQYADYAVWQRKHIAGDALKEKIAYWKRQLDGAPHVLNLPTDYKRPPAQSLRGESYSFVITTPLSERLRDASRHEGVTPFMTLVAAFGVLMWRYSGQNDILLGMPVSGRTRAEIENLIGFFINMLVLRLRVLGEESFLDLLREVRQVCIGAYTHQEAPFEDLVEELGVERDLSRQPLCQVVFNLLNREQRAPDKVTPPQSLDELRTGQIDVSNKTAKFDLSVSITEFERELRGDIEYTTDLFKASTVERMLGHYLRLLQDLLSEPDRPLWRVQMLSEQERKEAIFELNDTSTPYPKGQCIHQLFDAQVERTPDAVAVVYEDAHLTYSQLNRRSNQLARRLRALGFNPEAAIALYMDRSPETIVCMLGAIKAGGAYLPLDIDSPPSRLLLVLAEVGVEFILTQSGLADRLPEHGATVIEIDSAWRDISRESCQNLTTYSTPESLAYVIFTSGSTGVPKGIAVPHRAVVRLVCNTNYISLSASDCIAHLSNASFDAMTFEVWGALLHGARLVGFSKYAILDPQQLTHLLRSRQIGTLFLTTALFNQIISECSQAFAGLDQALFGGEIADVSRVREALVEGAAPRRLLHVYGPTESTTFATWHELRQLEEGSDAAPIGKPLSNTRVYLLGDRMMEAPVGVAGEIYLGGDGLAIGYWRAADLTAQSFIPDPYGGEPGGRLYRTGDIGRFNTSWDLEFVGRIDHQVKIRGFRIELGEVETALLSLESVRDAVVLARAEGAGHKYLVAYVVMAENRSDNNERALRQSLKALLPDYMAPAAFVFLDAMPLNVNGKVDRRALLDIPIARRGEEGATTEARTSREKILVSIWNEVLGAKNISIHDNFFELGGDSILTINIISKAKRAGIYFTPKQIYQYQTIAELAEITDMATARLVPQGVVVGPAPLTPIQRLFFSLNLQNLHHWNQALTLRTQSGINADYLQEAVRHLLWQHDALRLRFIPEGSGWRQFNAGMSDEAPFAYVNITALSEREQIETIERQASEWQASLNITDGPLLRVVLFDCGQRNPSRVLIVVHHLAVDIVSWRLLLEDLQKAYKHLSEGREVKLPPKTTSYKRWAELLAEYAHSDQLRDELAYWMDKRRLSVEPIPRDESSGFNSEASARVISAALTPDETESLLREVPKAYKTNISEVLLTALAQGFEPWTGKKSLLVNVEGHGREDIFEGVDLSRTVGWFTSIYPVMLSLDNNESVGEALKSVKEQMRRIPRGGIGYGILSSMTGQREIEERFAEAPKAEVSFNYFSHIGQTIDSHSQFSAGSESSGAAQNPNERRTHLIDVTGGVVDGRLRMNWTYSENIHKYSTIESLAQNYIAALRAIIAHCKSPGAGGFTPSDFSLAGLDDHGISKLSSILDEIGKEEE